MVGRTGGGKLAMGGGRKLEEAVAVGVVAGEARGIGPEEADVLAAERSRGGGN